MTAELKQRVAERTSELLDAVQRQSELAQLLPHADRRRNEFLALLGHELQNPLAPVRNAMAILRVQNTAQNETLNWCVDVIERQANQLTRLVDDLLDVSRVSQGTIKRRRDVIDVHGILHAAIEASRPLIDARRHTLDAMIGSLPVPVCGDSARLRQVVANLLNNAARYQNEGRRIEVRVASNDEGVAISVRDWDIGVAPDMLTHVFELFTQDERARDVAQGALGIGLSLVTRLVELHDGTALLTSEGVGTRHHIHHPTRGAVGRSGARRAPERGTGRARTSG